MHYNPLQQMENIDQFHGEPGTPKLSKEERIELHFTTSNEHWNKFAFEIYTGVIESRLFDDVEIPLDAFRYATNLLWNGRNRPLSAVKALMVTFDEQTDETFTDERKRFILSQLMWYYKNTVFTDSDGKEYGLDQIKKLLQQERDKLPEPAKDKAISYDWNATKEYINTLPDNTAKISHLLKQKAEYKQAFHGLKIKGWGPEYDEQCQAEIKKLKDLVELEKRENDSKSPFKLSNKQGAKTNLIRLLNAIYEINLIELNNGQRPTKEQFMREIGGFLGVDMKLSDQILSKALEQPLEVNIAVFEELKQIIQAQVLARLEKGRK